MIRAIVIISFIFLLFYPFKSNAQFKYEKEYRIKSKLIPQKAINYIDSINLDAKVKWFKEVGMEGISYEAKFKLNKRYYSVEFDSSGLVQDIEFIIKKAEIDSGIYKKLTLAFDSIFKQWKIQKIQLHINNYQIASFPFVSNNNPIVLKNMSYEIIIKGKNDQEQQLYEITFNYNGELQSTLQIIQDKTDHLEY